MRCRKDSLHFFRPSNAGRKVGLTLLKQGGDFGLTLVISFPLPSCPRRVRFAHDSSAEGEHAKRKPENQWITGKLFIPEKSIERENLVQRYAG